MEREHPEHEPGVTRSEAPLLHRIKDCSESWNPTGSVPHIGFAIKPDLGRRIPEHLLDDELDEDRPLTGGER